MVARRIKGQWWIDVRVKAPGQPVRRVRQRSPVQTKRGAEEYERQFLEVAYGLSKPRHTLEDFARNEFSAYAQANCRPSDSESKESILRKHLVPAFGHLDLSEITAQEIELYKAEKLREKKSPKTVNNHLTVLRKLLTLAHEYGAIDAVPRVRWCKVPPQRFDFLTEAELSALLSAAEPEWQPMIWLAAYAGLRLGELLGLRWTDYDQRARRITVAQSNVRGRVGPPKNNRIRHVPLPAEATAMLARLSTVGELVFSHPSGRAYTKNETKRPLWRACKAAGLRLIGWHVLRHTYASHLVGRGASLYAVQNLLGHSTITMTQRYAHLSTENLADTVALLNRGHLMGTSDLPKSAKRK